MPGNRTGSCKIHVEFLGSQIGASKGIHGSFHFKKLVQIFKNDEYTKEYSFAPLEIFYMPKEDPIRFNNLLR